MADASTPTSAGRRYRPSDAEPDFDRTEQVAFAPNLFTIVRHNMCSQADANKVWTETLDEWELDSSSQAERAEVRAAISTAFAISTSKDDENLSTVIYLRSGKAITLRVLYDKMGLYFNGDNDSRLRVFARCFEKGFFVKNQWDMLSDPANAELRLVVAGRIGQDAALARYMFDTADFLSVAGVTLSAQETSLIQSFKTTRTAMAGASARSTGEVAPRNDTTSVNSVRGPRVPAPISAANNSPMPSSDARMNLAGLNLR